VTIRRAIPAHFGGCPPSPVGCAAARMAPSSRRSAAISLRSARTSSAGAASNCELGSTGVTRRDSIRWPGSAECRCISKAGRTRCMSSACRWAASRSGANASSVCRIDSAPRRDISRSGATASSASRSAPNGMAARAINCCCWWSASRAGASASSTSRCACKMIWTCSAAGWRSRTTRAAARIAADRLPWPRLSQRETSIAGSVTVFLTSGSAKSGFLPDPPRLPPCPDTSSDAG